MQQQSAAIGATVTDPETTGKASDLHQRQSMTFMRLVHTEEVTAFRLFDPCLPSEG